VRTASSISPTTQVMPSTACWRSRAQSTTTRAVVPATDAILIAGGVAKRRSSYTLGGMCSRSQCPTCNRPTYQGCGNHVEQVLGDVPPSERCQCAEERRQAKAARPKRSWFATRSAANR